MDQVVELIKRIVLDDIHAKGLDNVSLTYIIEFVSSIIKTIFSAVIQGVLEDIDTHLMSTRDKSRYINKDRLDRTICTLSGSFSYHRRYYKDTVTDKMVFLLDEIMRIPPRIRLFSDISQVCAGLNGFGLSYRGAERILELVLGERVVSHEEIREHTLQMAEIIRAKDEADLLEDIDEVNLKEIPILFMEADGFFVSEQRKRRVRKKDKDKRNQRFEAKVVVVHEGWEKRHKKDYKLINPQFYSQVADGDDDQEIWESVRASLERKYKDLGKIQIVINGDGAEWIRRGVNYFGKAIYQYDRFHITRDVGRAVKGHEDLWEQAKNALNQNQIEELHPILAECLTRSPVNDKMHRFIIDLIARVEKDLEYIVDYRMRIDKEISQRVELRGMGAAEPSVKRYKNRMKSVGKAWSKSGAGAMVTVLSKYFSGTYADYMDIGYEAYGSERDRVTDSDNKTLSAGQIQKKIKGIFIDRCVIRGSIAPVKPGYTSLARTLRIISA